MSDDQHDDSHFETSAVGAGTAAPSIEELIAGTSAVAADVSGANLRIETGKAADLVLAGAGNDRIETGKGADIVQDLGGSDRIDLGKGSDTYIYDAALNEGARDRVDGGSGTDTLVLALQGAQWFSTALQADISRLLAAMSQAGDGHHGGDAGGPLDAFQFGAFNLTVKDFEAIRIFVDGREVSLQDDAVTAVADHAVVDAGGAVSGQVLGNDQVPDLVASVELVSLPVTGQLTFASDGSFSFDAGTGFEGLAQGQTHDVTFIYRVTDADGDSDEATVTITITGANDVPVVTGTVAGAVAEDGVLAASGQLTATDVDTGDSVSFAGDAAGSFGAFSVDATGAWAYALDNVAAQVLAAGQVVTEVFTVSATDSFGAVTTQDVTITITGANDVPVVTGTVAGAVTAAAGSDVATGALVLTDVDGDVLTASGDSAGTYGSFAVDADGQWSYALNAAGAAYQALASGTTATETFTVHVDDGHGGSVDTQVTVDVLGTVVQSSVASTITIGAGVSNFRPDATGLGISYSAPVIGTGTTGPVTQLNVIAASGTNVVQIGGDFAAEGLGAPGLTYQGGPGQATDIIYFGATNLAASFSLGDGFDQFRIEGAITAGLSVDGGAGTIDQFVVTGFTAGHNLVDLSGLATGSISIDGVTASVTGFERVAYVGSNDAVIGGTLNEQFQESGVGNVSFSGGAGDDTFYFNTDASLTSGDSIDGGSGIDTFAIMTSGVAMAVIDASGMSAANGTLAYNGQLISVSNVETLFFQGGGAATVTGTSGNDTFNAGSGASVFEGGGGADFFHLRRTGTLTADTIIFNEGDGHDYLYGFVAGGASGDVIELHQVTTASGTVLTDFAQLAGALTCNNSGTANPVSYLNFGNGDGITLYGVDASLLNAADYLFT